MAVGAFLMLTSDEPGAVPGALSISSSARLFVAAVPQTDVAVTWLVGDAYVMVVRLRDRRTGAVWGSLSRG